jgi:hypothetical protein
LTLSKTQEADQRLLENIIRWYQMPPM